MNAKMKALYLTAKVMDKVKDVPGRDYLDGIAVGVYSTAEVYIRKLQKSRNNAIVLVGFALGAGIATGKAIEKRAAELRAEKDVEEV